MPKYNIRARGFDFDVGDSEICEILKAREEDSGEFMEAVDASEGEKRGSELRREASGERSGAVKEGERMEGRERLKGSVGEREVRGAVRERKREEMAKGFGGITSGGIVGTRVCGSGDVEGLEGSKLFRVKR